MKYLDTNKGMVIVNMDGDPIEIEEGSRVKLFDSDGNRLFSYEYTSGEDNRVYHETFAVDMVLSGALQLIGSTFGLILAVESVRAEPVIVACDGSPYGNERDLFVSFERCDHGDFKITATTTIGGIFPTED